MEKACSPFLVTVATLHKRAYKYIAGKHWGAASASASRAPEVSVHSLSLELRLS